MSNFNINNNNGNIGNIGDRNYNFYSQSTNEIIDQIERILHHKDEILPEEVKKDLLLAKSEANNNNIKSAIGYIKKAGPWISEVSRKVSANLISEIIKSSI